MTSNRSTSDRNGTARSNGVAGFRTTPGLTPASRISRIVARTSWSLSTWTVRSSTPASAKAFTKCCGWVTIRCASKGTLVRGRIEDTTAGPIVRFGTKCPSITSMWIMSAPASTASFTCSPRRSNRADRMEGAILIRIVPAKERGENKDSFPGASEVGRSMRVASSAEVIGLQREIQPEAEGEHVRLHDVLRSPAEPRDARMVPLHGDLMAESHRVIRRGRRCGGARHVRSGTARADRDGRERAGWGRHVRHLAAVHEEADRHMNGEVGVEVPRHIGAGELPVDRRADRGVRGGHPGFVRLEREGPHLEGRVERGLYGGLVGRPIGPHRRHRGAFDLEGADLLDDRQVRGLVP